MAEKLTRRQIAEAATISAQAPRQLRNAPVDRTFELPGILYAATVGLFLGYVAIMGWGFAHPEMILPVAIFAIFIVAGFGVPAIWTRLAPDSPARAKSWSRFVAEGIDTATGPLDAKAASVQVVILPVLIFGWGVAVVSIAALAR
ncbi:hypothetical protein [Aurantiacibacter spongiae]|uniref:Uncharacterized protein n=1 Tax=Aurantiacibacter spongiae TaxID=2488860 RepID=A0A3N5D8A0_9SPHN|nr:hypothetical protein [Aurantiacibacter spongiae]RPF70828.1 hypothetical protein EG799_03725 [Aurantiacibacter spongiae]